MTNRLTPILLALLTAAVPAFAEMATVAEASSRLGMSAAAIERVRDGKVVVEELEASSDKDLSLALVARLDVPLEEVYEFLASGRLLEISTVTQSAGDIDTSTFSLAEMELPDEVLQQLVDDPADTFHMSVEEAARVTEAASQGKAATLAAYRSVLSARARAYWERGVEGIAPYAGKGRSPEADLRHASEATRKLIHNATVLAELDAVPSKSSGKARHRLSWAIEKGRDQAAPVLNHRILYAENDGEVSIVRRFYSGYDYDCLQIVAGILPVGDRRSVVFYMNRTYTAQVAGFGGGAKRSIGRKLMQKELVAEVQRAQQAIRGDN